ncbi:hypothetical protein [Hyalangium sp.]|uniref:hypothetical protein n=1 Tax=Hyalangium sp. TaxID=2028555 RepID=UPI002D3431DB|nr:hypothetical protein [Hyalangium sp.]HYH96596.1 hypothetical protein [Hyalangium sp.]
MHANTHLHANDRQGLKRLCRYGARGALALERLSRTEDGRAAGLGLSRRGVRPGWRPLRHGLAGSAQRGRGWAYFNFITCSVPSGVRVRA